MYYFTLLEVGAEWVQIWVSVELGGPLLEKKSKQDQNTGLINSERDEARIASKKS